ncbi:hypothetical protein [Thetidibacter halocola]|uniref:Uncharacterized protein n=1 Tax=Thetidibacter halocola TaxID=2827239 RepID=A0A8J7WGS1_9RHOB|nr:hypothetical protein [Thetidibacter halocola]MBS0125391.1 hypothetical protein [Thetidibacter halocola]
MRHLLAVLTTLLMPLALWAAPPGLAVYVTDENVDVYVATYGDQAVELTGCTGESAARAILALDGGVPVDVTTFSVLSADFALGAHPAIPCLAAPPEETAWPADTRIWADLEGSGNYFLAAPDGPEFYALPRRCETLKAALDIRARLQRSGVLQGLDAPPGAVVRVTLDCGDAVPGDPAGPQQPAVGASATWSLHSIDVLLSDVGLDRIFVARLSPPEGSMEPPRYLPVWRLDGQPVAELFLTGGDALDAAESRLKALLGQGADAPVTLLGAEARTSVDNALYADICTEGCDGYDHRHGYFAFPGVDFQLTEDNVVPLVPAIDRLGRPRLGFSFGPNRQAVFIGCGVLISAMGLSDAGSMEWAEAARFAEARAGSDRREAFICPPPDVLTCLRRIAPGASLTASSFRPGAACAGRRILDLRLPALSRSTSTINLDGSSFDEIILRPDDGLEKAQLRVAPGQSAGVSACLLSRTESLISARGLPRLSVYAVDLVREGETGGGEVIGIEVENGTLAAEALTVMGDSELSRAVARGLSLCRADLYLGAVALHGNAVALQAFGSRILGLGGDEAPLTLSSDVYGLILSGGTQARFRDAEVNARTGLVLRTAQVSGTRVALVSQGPSGGVGDALQLNGVSTAEFFSSLARGFRCVAAFWSAEPSVRFVLPSNRLSAENTMLSCGAGALVIEE